MMLQTYRLRGDKVLNGPIYFPQLITLDLRTVQWHASLIFLLCQSVSQTIHYKLTNTANRRGVELGFCAKTNMHGV